MANAGIATRHDEPWWLTIVLLLAMAFFGVVASCKSISWGLKSAQLKESTARVSQLEADLVKERAAVRAWEEHARALLVNRTRAETDARTLATELRDAMYYRERLEHNMAILNHYHDYWKAKARESRPWWK